MLKAVVNDGLSSLNEFLSEGDAIHDTLPTVPFDLAFEFILSQLKPLGAKREKAPALPGVSNPVRGKGGIFIRALPTSSARKIVQNLLINARLEGKDATNLPPKS